MDPTAALGNLATLLSALPEESVESLLAAFDSLVSVSDPAFRPAAAGLLRRAAAVASHPQRRLRLEEAALAVAAGSPATNLVTQPKSSSGFRLTNPSGERFDREGPEDRHSREASRPAPTWMDAPPPPLPHLAVSDFFSGLVLRIGRDFTDAQQSECRTGECLTLIISRPADQGWSLKFFDRNLLFRIPQHQPILRNQRNLWFQPVPVLSSLEDLLLILNAGLDGLDDDQQTNAATEQLESLRVDLARCEAWLAHPVEPAPRCQSGPMARKFLGRDHPMAAWTPWFFAAIRVVPVESQPTA